MNETLEHMASAPTNRPLTVDAVGDHLAGLDGVLTLAPGPGDGTPEISWGDSFYYYAPDGVLPRTQPFATIVCKDYPEDHTGRLDRPGSFRVNIAAGRDAFVARTGQQPRDVALPVADPSPDDTVIAHPVYGNLGWLAVVNPVRTGGVVRELLQIAYGLARDRWHRR